VARFHLDNDVSDALGNGLLRRGHDILHTRHHGQARATDPQQLLTSVALNRILVTHNARDFLLIHHAWRLWPRAYDVSWPHHSGILAIPQPPRLAIERAGEDIDRIGQAGQSLADELYRWVGPGQWTRHPVD